MLSPVYECLACEGQGGMWEQVTDNLGVCSVYRDCDLCTYFSLDTDWFSSVDHYIYV